MAGGISDDAAAAVGVLRELMVDALKQVTADALVLERRMRNPDNVGQDNVLFMQRLFGRQEGLIQAIEIVDLLVENGPPIPVAPPPPPPARVVTNAYGVVLSPAEIANGDR